MTRTLYFEKPIEEIEEKISDLRKLGEKNQVDFSDEILLMEKRAQHLRIKTFQSLTPYQSLQIARHPDRPRFLEYAQMMFTDFLELKGDRVFGDDHALMGGPAFLDKQPVMILGHQKGKDTKSNIEHNFGMAQAEGYRKARRLMMLADKMQYPIITLIDTSGAYPGKGSEERGVAEAIAHNLMDMSQLTVPIIAVITGEGGSGGALGIAIGNCIAMLEHAVYSVISPEGCASILYRDTTQVETAMENLKIRAEDQLALGLIDAIIPEPLGGAHKDMEKMASSLSKYLIKEIKRLQKYTPKELIEHRVKKFRNMGKFIE